MFVCLLTSCWSDDKLICIDCAFLINVDFSMSVFETFLLMVNDYNCVVFPISGPYR